MESKQSQPLSLLDLLLRIMPDLRAVPAKARTDQKTAKVLYSLWSDESSHIAAKTFRRPDSIRKAEVENMERQGLVVVSGENIEITQRGAEVIKQMILGDNRSIFEDNGRPLDYFTALANLKPTRLRKTGKRASADEECHPLGSNWYTRAKK